MHQGWLLKKGGVGVGAVKSWIKRYFVLYTTSQGHFMFYYSDFTECPLFSQERSFRNLVDLAKATFIRPGSNKAEESDTPPHSFDIVTTEREWTLCAESQENVQRWMKLITRGLDEDVAILPDEELLFKVKPKVDPLGVLPSTDYTTSLRVSANGISVCVPDNSQSKGSYSGAMKEQLGVAPEREVYFWVYTDFYKWSLLSQGGKLALLINVFADSSFSRRNEYVFRNKEAVRLSTAIEYFIEKFMSVMHIRLETTEGAFAEETVEAQANSQAQGAGGLHHVSAEEWTQDEPSIDLLGMEVQSPGKPTVVSSATSNPFEADPFGEDSYPPAATPAPAAAASVDLFGDDPFGAAAPAPAPRPAPTPAPAPKAAVVDLFGDDPFGAPSPAPAPAQVVKSAPATASTSAPVVDLFGTNEISAPTPAPAPKAHSNPLDLFDSAFHAPEPNAVPSGPKQAPPLTQQQQAMHTMWFQGALAKNGGPLYDDGALQIATSVEVRGSQGRVTFFLRNNTPASFSDLKITLQDPAGLLRTQMPEAPVNLGALSQSQIQLMLECMKPASPGPMVNISYVDSLQGKRSNSLALPVLVTTFNEPLSIPGPDFVTRWESLTAPGLQQQEVFNPSQRILPNVVHGMLTTALKFGRVVGVPGESDYVVHGAASLRTGAVTATGEKISIGCLVKLEMNVQSNAVRVTVRTLHPAASLAVMATAKALLA